MIGDWQWAEGGRRDNNNNNNMGGAAAALHAVSVCLKRLRDSDAGNRWQQFSDIKHGHHRILKKPRDPSAHHSLSHHDRGYLQMKRLLLLL